MHLVPLSDFGVLKTYRLRDWCVCECTQVYKSMRSLIFIEKATPKNECLRLKTLDFWRLWKWRNWCDHEDLIFMRGTWSVKTSVFVVSFSLSWVIGNTVLLKGVEEILRKISKWCSTQNPTPTNPFEWSHWKSHTVQSISSVTETKFFWSLRNLFWLRS